MHSHIDQNKMVVDILTQIAKENNKSLERMKRLLLIKQNAAINRRFWEILDAIVPGHTYSYVGCCAECGSLELCEQFPF